MALPWLAGSLAGIETRQNFRFFLDRIAYLLSSVALATEQDGLPLKPGCFWRNEHGIAK